MVGSTASEQNPLSYPAILFIVGMSSAIPAGDLTLISAALLSIGHRLGFGTSFIPWIVTSTSLAMSATLIPAGRACDCFGSRRIFLIGILLFAGASLLAFGAANVWLLIIARMLQGVGAALIGPSAFRLIRTCLPGAAMQLKAIAALGVAQGAMVILGPLLGGLATRYSGGSSVFLIDAGISLIVAAVAFRAIPRDLPYPTVRASSDVAGTAMVVLTPVTLLLSLTLLESFGATSTPGLLLSALGILCVLMLLPVERRVDAPLIPPSILSSPVICGANLATFAIFAAAGILYVMTNMLAQKVLHLTPEIAGISMMAYGIAFVSGSHAYARLAAALRLSVLILVGAALTGLALTLLARVPDHGSTLWTVTPELALGGFGAAIAILASLAAGTASAADADQGVVSSLLMTLAQIGLPMGLAVATICMRIVATTASSPQASFRAAYDAGTVFAVLACIVGAGLSRLKAEDRRAVRASISRH